MNWKCPITRCVEVLFIRMEEKEKRRNGTSFPRFSWLGLFIVGKGPGIEEYNIRLFGGGVWKL